MNVTKALLEPARQASLVALLNDDRMVTLRDLIKGYIAEKQVEFVSAEGEVSNGNAKFASSSILALREANHFTNFLAVLEELKKRQHYVVKIEP